jgi:acetaldehyde dehydrogenase (acetylating)
MRKPIAAIVGPGNLDTDPMIKLLDVVFEATSAHAHEANADRYRDAVLIPS